MLIVDPRRIPRRGHPLALRGLIVAGSMFSIAHSIGAVGLRLGAWPLLALVFVGGAWLLVWWVVQNHGGA